MKKMKNEDLIDLTQRHLIDYRRQMFKAGKSLEIKANITRKFATAIVDFLEDEFKQAKQ